eukprot:CAMPEP_0184732460 /NCGR_PEP_ID=MMETSP0314-20130426/54346_1 /TAXON_ID=38298 /ORGANISM="Rhodella maculata, Strain CCMP 736" /LENGTH=479 /DNA_ID=CAMNT_0027199049 /DNA_START=242 /DNA_END=1678 /DNA_ORIENTATION=+
MLPTPHATAAFPTSFMTAAPLPLPRRAPALPQNNRRHRALRGGPAAPEVADPREAAREAEAAPRARLEREVRAAVVHVARHGGRGGPRPPLGLGTARGAERGGVRGVCEEEVEEVGCVEGFVRIVEVPRHLVLHEVRNPPRVRGHDRNSARHGLHDDKPERLRLARHEQRVGGRERLAQLVADELPREAHAARVAPRRELALQRRAERAVADEHDGCGVGEGREDVRDGGEVFLRAEAADVGDELPARRELERGGVGGVEAEERCAGGGAAEGGVEAQRVDALAPQADALDAVGGELGADLRGGCDGGVRAVVDHAEQGPDDGDQQAEAVVLGVDGEVGVVGHDEGLAEEAGVEQGAEDDEARGRDVDDVGVELAQRVEDARREAEAEGDGGVEREAEALDVHDAGAGKPRRPLLGVVRGDDQHLVARGLQPLQQRLEAVRVPGDVRERAGLDKDGDFPGGPPQQLQVRGARRQPGRTR